MKKVLHKIRKRDSRGRFVSTKAKQRAKATPSPAKAKQRTKEAPARTKAKAAPRYVLVPTSFGDRVRDVRTGRFVKKGRRKVARKVGRKVLEGDLLKPRTGTEKGFFKGRGEVVELDGVNFWSALSHVMEYDHIAYKYKGKIYKVPHGQRGFFADKLADLFDRYIKGAKRAMGGDTGSPPILSITIKEAEDARLFDIDTLGIDTDLVELMGTEEEGGAWSDLLDEMKDTKGNLFGE